VFAREICVFRLNPLNYFAIIPQGVLPKDLLPPVPLRGRVAQSATINFC